MDRGLSRRLVIRIDVSREGTQEIAFLEQFDIPTEM